METVEKGYYRHYKGGIYLAHFVSEHTENGSHNVIYEDIKKKIWERPLDMWLEEVEGKPRFAYIENQRDAASEFSNAKRSLC